MNESKSLVANSDTAFLLQLCFVMLLQDSLKFSASEESNERYSDFRGGKKARSEIFYKLWTKTISKKSLENLEYQIISSVEGIYTEGSAADIKLAISPSNFLSGYEAPSLSCCSVVPK